MKYEYENTGIDRIGKMPKHWKTKILKRRMKFEYGTGLKEENRLDGNVDVYGSNGIVGKHNKSLSNGPTIIIGRKGTAGAINFSDKSCFPIDTTYFIDSNFTSDNLCFLFYALQILELDRLNNDTAVPGLSREVAYKEYLPFPPKYEQVNIAKHLDFVCSNIDRIVEIKHTQIKYLQNLLLSIKEKLVINKKWKRYKIRYITRMKSGDTIRNENLIKVGEYPVYGGNGVIGFTTDFNVNGETIILGRVGAKCGNVHSTNKKAWISDNAIIVKTHINYEFLALILEYLNLNSLASDTAQPLLTAENVKKLYVYIPDKITQIEILNKVKSASDKIHLLIGKVNKQIDTLMIYKKTLIYEVVTGKKQVYSD